MLLKKSASILLCANKVGTKAVWWFAPCVHRCFRRNHWPNKCRRQPAGVALWQRACLLTWALLCRKFNPELRQGCQVYRMQIQLASQHRTKTQDEERRTEASERMVLEHHHYPMEEALSKGGTQDYTWLDPRYWDITPSRVPLAPGGKAAVCAILKGAASINKQTNK